MKFRRIAPERWQSFDGRYEIWMQVRVRPVAIHECRYAACFVRDDNWLGEGLSFSEAITACRNHAAKQVGVARG